VKKVKPDNSKTIYVGGIYEVDKTSGGSIQRTVTYYPVAGAMRINSTLYYTLKDHLGSASVVTDASGNILGTQRYYPYGETRLSTGTIFTDKLFTGQREMRRPEPVEGAGLGIYHYGARFYSPKLGRFLSADTIVPGAANPQAYNRYSYVLGNPLKYTDPSGYGQCQTQEDCADMGTTPMGTGNPHNGGGNDGGRDGCRHNDPDCRGDEEGGVGNGGTNGCGGPNPSVVCIDPTLIGEYYAYTNLDYVETLYPFNPENSRLAELTRWRAGSGFLLLHDILALGLGSDWVARWRDDYVSGMVPYELHKNEIGYYATVKNVIVMNNSNSNIVVNSIESSSAYEFRSPSKHLIGKDQSLSIPLADHMSTSITINIWPNLQITAQIPWHRPTHINP